MSMSTVRAAMNKALEGSGATLGRVSMGYVRAERKGRKVDLQRLDVEFTGPTGDVSHTTATVEPGDDLTAAAVQLAAFYRNTI